MSTQPKAFNKSFDFNKIDPFDFYNNFNKILTKYCKTHKLNKPLRINELPESERKTKNRGEVVLDIFFHYFTTEGLIVPIQRIYDLVPEIYNYSSPISGTRRTQIINQGRIFLKFFGFTKAKAKVVKKYNKFLEENGRPSKRFNCYDGKALNYKSMNIGCLANTERNKSASNKLTHEEFVNTVDIEIVLPNDIVIKAVKAYFLTLANTSINNKIRDRIDFSDFCSEKEYIDKFLTDKTCKDLSFPEVVIFQKVLSVKYQLLKEHIIKSCDYLLKLLPTAYKFVNATSDATSDVNNTNSVPNTNTSVASESFANQANALSYGLSFVTRSIYDYLGLSPELNKLLDKEHIEYFEDCTVNQIVEVLNHKVTQPPVGCKIYKMSPFNYFSTGFYNYSKYTDTYRKYFDNSTGINIAIRRSGKNTLQNVRRIMCSTLLKKAIANNERITLYLDSSLLNATADLIDNCGSVSKEHKYVDYYAITCLQTESKIPIIFESADALVSKVKTLPQLLQNLQYLGLNNKNLLLSGNSENFSNKNLATLEALDYKYCFLTTDLKVLSSLAQKYRIGQWIQSFKPEYQLYSILDQLTFKNYLKHFFVNKKFKGTILEKHVRKTKPEFIFSSVLDRPLNVLHALPATDFQTAFALISNQTHSFYQQYHNQISTEQQLQELEDPAKEYFYINNEGQLDYNYDVIESKVTLNNLCSMVCNDVTLSDVDMFNVYRNRMYLASSFSRLKTYQEMNKIVLCENDFGDLDDEESNIPKTAQQFINWNTLVVYNTLEYLLNTPITGDSRKAKSRELSRQFLMKETAGSVDALLCIAINSFKVSFISQRTRPIYTNLNEHGKAIVNLLNAEIPEIYQDVGFIESSSRIVTKVKQRQNSDQKPLEASELFKPNGQFALEVIDY